MHVKPAETEARIAVVSANHNTRLLIAQLIYSLYTRCRQPQLARVFVVDNASTDGSKDLLLRMVDAGLCEVILNDEQRYHGPALNQAMNWLAEQQAGTVHNRSVDYVWILDSDCVIIRDDTLSNAILALRQSRAALGGQKSANRWHSEETIGLYSLLTDPVQVWREPIPSFEQMGEPSLSLQLGCARAGLSSIDFPFTRDGYIVHRGRSTLSEVLARREIDNEYYDWAVEHHLPHFNTEPGATDLYRQFQDEFVATCCDESNDEAVVLACLSARASIRASTS
jgi:hypothetical protein